MPSHPVVILAPTSAAQMVVKFSWVSDGALKMPQSDGERERERERAEERSRLPESCAISSHIPSKSILRKEGRKRSKASLSLRDEVFRGQPEDLTEKQSGS